MHLQSKELPKIAGKPPEGSKRQGGNPLEVSEGASRCQHLNFRFLASRSVRQYISVIVSHPVCGTCYSSTSKLILAIWRVRESKSLKDQS